MSALVRVAAARHTATAATLAVVLVTLAAGCTRGQSRAKPLPPTSSSTSTAGSVEPSATESATTSDSPTTTPPTTESLSPSVAPSETATATSTGSASTSSEPSTPPAVVDAAQLAQAKKLLVDGPDLGPKWISAEVPADESQHEQGDLCGTATAGAKNRLFGVSADLTNDGYNGAGRHEIARYQPGGAATAARAILDLLSHCPKGKQDFDGQQAEVTVKPVGANIATFSLTFASGAVNYGALAITNTGDYVSTSASFAADPQTAMELAGNLDTAARNKLAAAGVK